MNQTQIINYPSLPSLSELHCSYNTSLTHCLRYPKYSFLCHRAPKMDTRLSAASIEEERQLLASDRWESSEKCLSVTWNNRRGSWQDVRGSARRFLKLTVQETVWLQRCYLWCSIAFCRKKRKYWQIVHYSCWINHLSTSQRRLQCLFSAGKRSCVETFATLWTVSCTFVQINSR